MSLEPLLRRRFLLLRLLSASLVAGALYDLGFAALMLVAPAVPAELFGLPLPGEDFYLDLIAVFLGMLASLYLVAAHDPRRYSAVIVVAIAGRLAGAAVFLLAATASSELAGLYPLAAADLAFGLAHAACWLPLRASG